MNLLFNLSPAQLGNLNAEQSVEIFRDLLWCHARKHGVPATKIHITSQITISDGGIDAKIDNNIPEVPSELLISAGTSYQLKSGRTFKPWQPSQLHKELFGSTKAEVCIDNLDGEVRNCLEQESRYVIICFGCDPTVPQIGKAKEHLRNNFERCGFKNSQVEVWGQTHLVGLISEFPSIILKILGRSEYQFQTVSGWTNNDDMTPSLELGDEQKKWIRNIREALRTSNDHLRIIGEPGIGKSRLVLEALSTDDLNPNVVYIPYADDFQKSQLFNELLRADIAYHVILVVDECSNKDRASIWNVMKAHRSKYQLVTINHGPERSSDEAMRILFCPSLADEQIAAIINSYIDTKEEAKRWAAWCSGSPRVAHAVGQNLQRNPDDIFKPPATVPIWERFVAGYEDASSEICQQSLTVLRHIALFQKFGFEPPVTDEARFIADITIRVDPAITWGRFQSIIELLRERRILQGRTTLFLVPKALHVYLWLDYWKHHGRGFDFQSFIGNLPEGLLGWFTRMFIYAHANPLAQNVVKDILAPKGPYDDDKFVISEVGTNFLSVLAEANPKATLQCIERTYGAWGKERLCIWETGRQNVVWALEKIAIWEGTFRGAAHMLLRMGATETSNYSNNASGMFSGMFSLAYGPVAPTEAPPAHRLPMLAAALRSEDIDERNLGLKACETALSTHSGFRVIGAEYQGLKPVARLWMPKIYDEIFDAYRAVWNLLFDISRVWPDKERKTANNILISSAHGLVQIDPLASEILTTIEKLIDDSATKMRVVIEFIVDTRRFRANYLSPDIMKRINQLDEKLAGTTLEQRINRYVLNCTWSEERDEDTPGAESLEMRVADLAKRAINNLSEFSPLVQKLVCSEGHKLYQFGFELGKIDKSRKLQKKILASQHATGSTGTTQFIGGYLRAIREISEGDWETILSECLFDDEYRKIAGELILRTGVNNNLAKKMLQAYAKNILNAKDFVIFRFSQETKQLNQKLIEKILAALLKKNDEGAIFVALEIVDSFYRKDVAKQMPKKLIFKLLTKPKLFIDHLDTMQEYHWGEVAKKYLDIYPEQGLNIFKLIMIHLENQRFMTLKSTSTFLSIVEKIVTEKPAETWNIVQSLLGNQDSALSRGLMSWLQEESSFGEKPKICPLTYFPMDAILAWIDDDAEKRAPAIAHVVPKTFDKENSGWITRELLHRYGHLERVKSALSANFHTDGWSGPASAHYRKKRDQARSWLNEETSPNVLEWLEEYIDRLTSRIDIEEISEEREFY